jgi:hypothetical protein
MPGIPGTDCGVEGAAGRWAPPPIIPPMPPCIIAMLRQHGHPPVACACEGVLGAVVGLVATGRIMPHMPPEAGALAIEPVAGAAPHICVLAGTAHASESTVAVRARELRILVSSD